MLALVLGWTQCLPQGVGAPPAMLRGRTAGFLKKTRQPGLRRGRVGGYNLHSVPPDCGTPTTSRLYPFGHYDHHYDDHHHSCRLHATKTTFISSTTLLCLSIHLAVVPEISTSWYQYPFLQISLDCVFVAETWVATWSLSFW